MSTTGFIIIIIAVVTIASIIFVYLWLLSHPKINGKRCFSAKEYYDEKTLRRKFFRSKQDGTKEGCETVYYPTGEINKIQHWKEGKRHGEFTVFLRDGNVYINGEYDNGVVINQNIINNI